MRPAYPDHFPCPTWDYGFTRNQHHRATPFENGWTRRRERWPQRGGSAHLVFSMPTYQFGIWSVWMNANGYDWFRMLFEPGVDATLGYQLFKLSGPIEFEFNNYDRITARVAGELIEDA